MMYGNYRGELHVDHFLEVGSIQTNVRLWKFELIPLQARD